MMNTNYYQNHPYDFKAPASLKLIFSTQVDSPVYTGRIIVGKASGDNGNKSIKVMLVDSNTQETITTEPLASTKVEIVLVPGDYVGSTTREFETNIVNDWENKKNILQGGLYLKLQHGCGTIGEIKIKHDRHPIKNVKFRLGAKVVDCPYEVQEAISCPFEVKDFRNFPKTLRKLSLEDNVGRLKNISNKGKIRSRLESKGILTVKEFLYMHYSNPKELQKICGIKGKKWEMTLNHAKTAVKRNVCMHTESTSQQANTWLPNDYDQSSIEFDNCYKPQPLEDMIEDLKLSTDDFEVCEAYFNVSESRPEGGMTGSWDLVGNHVKGDVVEAKKRWKKLRIFSFSIGTFTKKVGSLVRMCYPNKNL